MLLCRCVLLCTHLRDLVPRFRRHPFLDLGLENVCVCVCVCMIRHLCWCVVVGCCVRTFGTRCLVFGDTLFLIMDLQVCVCISVIVSLCVVVYALTGPGASFSETPFSRPWT